MNTKIDNIRMTNNEASERYPDSYILMRMDNMTSDMGTVLYVCDTEKELITLLDELDDRMYCGMVEGLNLQSTLGGVVVYG